MILNVSGVKDPANSTKSTTMSGNSGVSSSTKISCNNQSAPQIFKLNVDCFEHLFEWLSLKQLLMCRCTCFRMQRVVDYYIKLNYPKLSRLYIRDRQQLLAMCNGHLIYFEWIKQLTIHSIQLNSADAGGIKRVLSQLEILQLNNVDVNGDFYEIILKHCPHLKHLDIITRSNTIIGTGNEWLLRQYPMLKHFEIHVGREHRPSLQYAAELSTFFQLNSQIRIFSVNFEYLGWIKHILLELSVKFDRLVVYAPEYLQSICNLTNDLYEHGIYERLHLYLYDAQFDGGNFSTFNNLEKLYFCDVTDEFTTPIVASVKELSIRLIYDGDVPQMIAENFINLRIIDLQIAEMHDIRPFVCHAPNIQQIRVGCLDFDWSDDILIELNKERKKLAGACKVAIHVDERLFLLFKWATKISLNLIELKRIDARE